MQFIQMETNDHRILTDNAFKLSHSYASGNRRAYIAKLAFSYIYNKMVLETMCKDLKYFKKLLAENTSDEINEYLKDIISIMEKYIEMYKGK